MHQALCAFVLCLTVLGAIAVRLFAVLRFEAAVDGVSDHKSARPRPSGWLLTPFPSQMRSLVFERRNVLSNMASMRLSTGLTTLHGIRWADTFRRPCFQA